MSREISTVLDNLQFVIAQTEVHTKDIGLIEQIDVEFVVEIGKKAGAGTPNMWLLPEGLVNIEFDETNTTTIKFVLENKAVARDARDIPENIGKAIETVTEAIVSLRKIQHFVVSEIVLEFGLELNKEGELKFFFKAGGSQKNGHKLSLKFKPK